MTDLPPLTETQHATLTFMYDHIAAHGVPPTFSQIAEHAGICKGAVHERMQYLVAKGYVRVDKHQSRGYRPIAVRAVPLASFEQALTGLPDPVPIAKVRERLRSIATNFVSGGPG